MMYVNSEEMFSCIEKLELSLLVLIRLLYWCFEYPFLSGRVLFNEVLLGYLAAFVGFSSRGHLFVSYQLGKPRSWLDEFHLQTR